MDTSGQWAGARLSTAGSQSQDWLFTCCSSRRVLIIAFTVAPTSTMQAETNHLIVRWPLKEWVPCRGR